LNKIKYIFFSVKQKNKKRKNRGEILIFGYSIFNDLFLAFFSLIFGTVMSKTPFLYCDVAFSVSTLVGTLELPLMGEKKGCL